MSRVLYVVACAAGAVGQVPTDLLPRVGERGWDVHVLATSTAVEAFPSTMADIEAATGRPVRTGFHTSVGCSLPDPDAVLVAPATYNTVVKLAAGTADTYVLTRLAEQMGRGVPVVVAPCVNIHFARHPAYEPALATLRTWGVRVVVGQGEPHEPGSVVELPWARLLDSLETDPEEQ